MAGAIHAGHFRRLAAHQSGARLAAAFGDALHDLRRVLDGEFAGGEIIEEEQGLSARDDQIIDAHGDQIDAYGAVQAGLDRDQQFGADAVGGGDQHGVLEARRLEVEQRAEAAETPHGAGTVGGACRRLDRLDQRIAGLDIDARILIAMPAHVRPSKGRDRTTKHPLDASRRAANAAIE